MRSAGVSSQLAEYLSRSLRVDLLSTSLAVPAPCVWVCVMSLFHTTVLHLAFAADCFDLTAAAAAAQPNPT